MAKIAINGLGRIGRAVFKIALDTPDLEVVAVNDLLDPENLTYLLRYDSVYGKYPKPVRADGDSLMVGDKTIRLYHSRDPVELPWKDMGIGIALECTGIFTNPQGLEKHLQAGAQYAILSAPSKGDGMKTIVPGVNDATKDDRMFSLASCTTNCIAPIMEIMQRRVGVDKALMTTVHAYTSSQNIVDGPSKKFRRGRAAAINLVPTTTGAAKAAAQAVPSLQNKFDGLAVRAPVPTGSIADVVFIANRPVSEDEINGIFREESGSNRYLDILAASDDPIVSSDIAGDPHAAIVDLTMTKVVDGNLVKVMGWYDNEWGYAAQMVRQAARMARTSLA
jgi:glyceraldehyde 3-phosphate dehydrogenase